ncbi:MAG: hypothetical protein JNK74_27540 [Candidatus Hydrogenedentes bacterium]|nr:hypothetical protein [Candidatus Hydrogenedentota bacterium]
MSAEAVEYPRFDAEGERLAELLCSTLAASDGFGLYFVCSASEAALDEVERRLTSESAPICRTVGYSAPRDLLEIVPDLLAMSEKGVEVPAVWVRVRGADDEITDAWKTALEMFDRERERLSGELSVALVVASSPELFILAYDQFPELWASRSSAFLFLSGPEGAGGDPGCARSGPVSGPFTIGDPAAAAHYTNLAWTVSECRTESEEIAFGRLLLFAARAWELAGVLDLAVQAAEEAERMAREIREDDVLRAEALHSMGSIALYRGDFAGARAAFETAIPILAEAGDLLGESAACHQLGSIDLHEGRLGEARVWLARSLLLKQSAGIPKSENPAILRHRIESEAATRLQLGLLELSEACFAEAHIHLGEALTLRRSIDDRAGEGVVLARIAAAAWERGQCENAYRLMLMARTLFELAGSPAVQSARVQLDSINEALAYTPERLEALRADAHRHYELDHCAAIIAETLGEA